MASRNGEPFQGGTVVLSRETQAAVQRNSIPDAGFLRMFNCLFVRKITFEMNMVIDQREIGLSSGIMTKSKKYQADDDC
jgi:hypothetical protein